MAARRLSRTISAQQRTDARSAHQAAVALLARRDFAGGELAAKLTARGFDPGVARKVVTELGEQGVLDDGRFAINYVAFHAARGQGPLRISALLRAAGVDQALAEAALADGTDWLALARRARAARFGPQVPVKWEERARQARFLQYRGFSADHIRAATGADPDTD